MKAVRFWTMKFPAECWSAAAGSWSVCREHQLNEMVFEAQRSMPCLWGSARRGSRGRRIA